MMDDSTIQEAIKRQSGLALQLRPGNMDAFKTQLALHLNELISHHFEQFVNLLYRLDVNEQQLRNLLASASEPSDTGLLVAQLVIERTIQKLQARQQFPPPGSAIPEDEKW